MIITLYDMGVNAVTYSFHSITTPVYVMRVV